MDSTSPHSCKERGKLADEKLTPFPPSPLTKSELYSRPVHDHVLSPQDCLATPCSVLRLNLKSLKLADIEVGRGEYGSSLMAIAALYLSAESGD